MAAYDGIALVWDLDYAESRMTASLLDTEIQGMSPQAVEEIVVGVDAGREIPRLTREVP